LKICNINKKIKIIYLSFLYIYKKNRIKINKCSNFECYLLFVKRFHVTFIHPIKVLEPFIIIIAIAEYVKYYHYYYTVTSL